MKKIYSTTLRIFYITIYMFPVLLSSPDAHINVQNGINNSEEVPFIEPTNQNFGWNKARNINPIYTSSGVVNGEFYRGVYIWEDIPYALPPIGDLRWKAPRKINSSQKLIKPKTKNFCIQRTSNFGGSSAYADEGDLISGSEDCLYLDISFFLKSPCAPKNNIT